MARACASHTGQGTSNVTGTALAVSCHVEDVSAAMVSVGTTAPAPGRVQLDVMRARAAQMPMAMEYSCTHEYMSMSMSTWT